MTDETKQDSIRFTGADRYFITALMRKTGANKTTVIRMALRRFAESEGIPPPPEKQDGREEGEKGQG